jgi:hypothetical protein
MSNTDKSHPQEDISALYSYISHLYSWNYSDTDSVPHRRNIRMDHSARMVTRRTLGSCSIRRKYITNQIDTKFLGFYTGTIAPTDVWGGGAEVTIKKRISSNYLVLLTKSLQELWNNNI